MKLPRNLALAFAIAASQLTAQEPAERTGSDSCLPADNDDSAQAVSDDPFAALAEQRRLEHPPLTLPITHIPRHPYGDQRRPGRVELDVIVDTTGKVELCSIQVVAVSDSAFLDPVLDWLHFVRYRPARYTTGEAARWRVRLVHEWNPPDR